MGQSISAIINDLRNPQTAGLEPGLLSVFRMIMGLQLILVLMGFSSRLFGSGDGPPLWVLSSGLIWLTGLLLYLSWPGLHERLDNWFLPPALIFSAIIPLLERIYLLWLIVSEGNDSVFTERFEDLGWRLLLFLLFPLIFTAWQYRMKHVLFFTVGTALITIGGSGWLFGWGSPIFNSVWPVTIGQSIVLTLIGYIVVRLISAQRLQRSKLTDANEKLADYAVTIDQLATSRERNRLARELHDTLSHTLSALSVQLEAADSVWEDAPEQARSLLIKSIANTRSGLAETRRALQDLRASPLEDLGLGLALRNLAQSTAKRDGLELVLDVPKQVEGLSDEQEQGFYRISQESLENVVKHANAKRLHFSLSQNDNAQWQLTIRDDGRGFEQNQQSENGRYGLQGMQERTAMLGGMLRVESQPGQGTEIRLIL